MPLDPRSLQIVAIAGVASGGLGLLVSLLALGRLRRLRRSMRALRRGDPSEALVEVADRQLASAEELGTEIDRLRAQGSELRHDLAAAVRHVAVVRYDAFQDMGGRMSFSAALLDDAGDGLVLTSINGRSETRTYAKGVKAGNSETTLSPEEGEAIARALRPGEEEVGFELGHARRAPRRVGARRRR